MSCVGQYRRDEADVYSVVTEDLAVLPCFASISISGVTAFSVEVDAQRPSRSASPACDQS